MSKNPFDPLTTAVLIVDLQNDFLDILCYLLFHDYIAKIVSYGI